MIEKAFKMNRVKFVMFIFHYWIACNMYSQSVGIGTPIPDSSAIMDVKSTTKGLLIPRMNTLQRDAIVNPAVGLQIFNIDDNTISFFDGVKWSKHGTQVDVTTTHTSWVRKADFGGGGRIDAVAFSIGDKGYLGTGYDGNYDRKDFWQYDPLLNVWTQKADLNGVARRGAVGFSIGDKGYIGTGTYFINGSYAYLRDFWEYNSVTNIWTQKANFGGVERGGAVGISIGGKGYIGTGSINAAPGYLSDFWQYDNLSDVWIQKADFGGGQRFDAVGFAIGNIGYLGTGFNNGVEKKDFWEYNPITNIWTQKADLWGVPRYGAVGFSIGDYGYIGFGHNGNNSLNDLVKFDPTILPNGFWLNTDFIIGGRREGAVGFKIGNKGYVGSGISSVFEPPLRDFWEYNPTITDINEYKETYAAVEKADHSWRRLSNAISTNNSPVLTLISGNLKVDGHITNSLNFPSTISDRKIVLYDRPGNNSYLGFDVEAYTLRYQVAQSGDKHEFRTNSDILLTIDGAGDVVLSGCLTTVNFNCPSDLRLKKNILPIANSLCHLLALKGYRYDWNDANKNATKQSGVLAQEVQKIFPHLVQENHTGMLSVNYIGLLPEIIETFKEIKSQSDKMSSDLLKRIEVLENQKKNQHER